MLTETFEVYLSVPSSGFGVPVLSLAVACSEPGLCTSFRVSRQCKKDLLSTVYDSLITRRSRGHKRTQQAFLVNLLSIRVAASLLFPRTVSTGFQEKNLSFNRIRATTSSRLFLSSTRKRGSAVDVSGEVQEWRNSFSRDFASISC